MNRKQIALYLPSLRGGGAERVMVNLARGFAERGHRVDLVLAKAEGPYLAEVPESIRVVDLGAHRVLASLPGLVRYLRREHPDSLLSAMEHANAVALWARGLARVPTRVVVSIHTTTTIASRYARGLKGWLTTYFAYRFYSLADDIVAVSTGVAEDQARLAGISPPCIKVIYNPVVTPELFKKAQEPVDHPWFKSGQPPVIIGVGRLTRGKDFAMLIRTFASVRRERPARLMILGEGEERASLEALVHDLGLIDDVALPGFVSNPYAYMARSSAFVLSSVWEGLPTVLIEAMACGCPVVSTDCPSGPAEILECGKWGTLVPVGDVQALARGITDVLDGDAIVSSADVKRFTLESAVHKYLEVLRIV